MKRGKKGLSPVIATALLIIIALILAIIIYVWIKSFIGEQVEKTVGLQPEPIQNFCKDIQFTADVSATSPTILSINVENTGQIPIFSVAVLKSGFAYTKNAGTASSTGNGVLSGETQEFDLPVTNSVDYKNGEVVVVPVLLGSASDGSTKSYTCDKQYGVKATVG